MGLRELEMNKYFIALIGFFTIFMSSCTYTNPGFPEGLRQYLPYEEGLVLAFKNADSVQHFNIKELIVDKEEKVSWHCKCQRDHARLYFSSNNQMTGQIFATASNPPYYESEIDVTILLKGKTFTKRILCNPFSDIIEKDLEDTLLLNNEQDNITILRNKGITEFTINGTKWTLVEQ